MRNIVVIDLNVIVSALLTSGIDRRILEAVTEDTITPVFSPDMLNNLARVLIRPHLKLELQDIKGALTTLKLKSIIVKPEIKISACRDASDNIILETTLAGNARAIVTNDPDLLVLNPFRGRPILNSRQFLKTLKTL